MVELACVSTLSEHCSMGSKWQVAQCCLVSRVFYRKYNGFYTGYILWSSCLLPWVCLDGEWYLQPVHARGLHTTSSLGVAGCVSVSWIPDPFAISARCWVQHPMLRFCCCVSACPGTIVALLAAM